jgi:hypothetical protein
MRLAQALVAHRSLLRIAGSSVPTEAKPEHAREWPTRAQNERTFERALNLPDDALGYTAYDGVSIPRV